MKPFFVHYMRTHRRTDSSVRRHLPKGFTAFVSPVNDFNVPHHERMVQFSVVFCSNKDEFSKKAGRAAVMELIPIIINKRELPDYLQNAHDCVEGEWCDCFPMDYTYILKYVV